LCDRRGRPDYESNPIEEILDRSVVSVCIAVFCICLCTWETGMRRESLCIWLGCMLLAERKSVRKATGGGGLMVSAIRT